MDDGTEPKPNARSDMLRDLVKGFGFTLAVAVFVGVLGWGFFWLIGANIEPGESFQIVASLALIALLLIGGQMALSPIVDAVMEEKESAPEARKFNIMHGLGALCAWLMAYYLGTLALDYFDQKEEHEAECETVSEKKLGPIRFSSSTCDR